jgi:hypothetical protein
MTEAAKKLLDTLDSLSEPERHQVFREILRRAALTEHETPSDDDLVAAADEVFLGLDGSENQERHPRNGETSGWSMPELGKQ